MKIGIAGLLASYVVAFDPPVVMHCDWTCQPVLSPVHWTSLIIFAIVAPLLLSEFWSIVRRQAVESVEKFEHELSAPHTGVVEDLVIYANSGPGFDFYLYGPCYYGNVPGGMWCPS